MGSTRRRRHCLSPTCSRAGYSRSSSVHRSSPSFSTCSSGQGTVLFPGSWHLCESPFVASLLRTHSLSPRLAFQIVMVVLYPTVIQPLFNKLSPLPAGDLRSRTESLARKLKFPLKYLYEIDGSKRSSHSNAYFFGLPWVRSSLSPSARLD